MEYILVSRRIFEHSDDEEFINEVNERLKQGWQLYGNPVVSSYYAPNDDEPQHYIDVYAQAMTKP
jgi:hypothetical protein